MATATKKPVKKATASKTQKTSDLPQWNIIYIFGYGESQIIGNGRNGKVANDALKNLEPLISHLANMQQKGTMIGLKDMHVLSISNGGNVDFRSGSEKNKAQRFEWSAIDSKLINKLANELISKIPEQSNAKSFIDMLKKNRVVRIPLKVPSKKSKTKK